MNFLRLTLSTFLFLFTTAMGVSLSQTTQGEYSPIIIGDGNTAIFGSSDVTAALDHLDSGRLNSLAQSGNGWQIASSLSDPGVAQRFFRNLKLAKNTTLLRSLLSAGLDPNAISRTPEGGSEALIVAAMRASNADSIVALLEAGAHPHGYQDILFSDSRYSFFMFPHLVVLRSSTLNAKEKAAIINAMAERGLVMLTSPGMSSNVTRYIDEVRNKHPQVRWHQFEECTAPDHYQCGFENSDRICSLNQKLKGAIEAETPRDFDVDFRFFYLKDYIGENEGRSYYLAASPGGWSSTVALIEIAADERSMRLMKFSEPSAGMGFCRSKPDGHIPDECWRSLSLEIDPMFETALWFGSAKMKFLACKR